MGTDATVIGAGRMGAAIVVALRRAGLSVTVWNRSEERVRPLAETHGAQAVRSVEEALEASPVVLVSLADHQAVLDALAAPLATAGSRLLLPFVTSTPTEAERLARLAADHGHRCVSGAIFGSPASVEAGASFVLLAGPNESIGDAMAVARHLGTSTVAGERHGDAAVLDAAILDVWYATATSFLHGLAVCAANGVDGSSLAPILSRVVPPTFGWLAGAFDRPGNDQVQCTNSTHAAAVATVVDTARSSGLPVDHLEAVHRYLSEGVRRGRSDDDLPGLREVFAPARQVQPTSEPSA